MSAYNIIKELVGSKEFYSNLLFYKDIAERAASKPVMRISDGSGVIFNKGEIYQSLNCNMVEFELNGDIHSYYIDEWFGDYKISKMTQERVNEMKITNSLKYPLTIDA